MDRLAEFEVSIELVGFGQRIWIEHDQGIQVRTLIVCPDTTEIPIDDSDDSSLDVRELPAESRPMVCFGDFKALICAYRSRQSRNPCSQNGRRRKPGV